MGLINLKKEQSNDLRDQEAEWIQWTANEPI